jgi:hypothetical protein
MGTTSTTVSLAWTPVPGATSYTISRNGTQAGTTTDPNYVDSGLSPETTYTYAVRAVNSAGQSDPSAGTTATTALAPNAIRISSPAGATSVPAVQGTYSLSGFAGSLFTSGLNWLNTASGDSGPVDFPGGSVANGLQWTALVPLSTGANPITITGTIPSAGNQTLTDSPANYTSFNSTSANGTGGQGFGTWFFNHQGNADSFLANNTTNMNVGGARGWGLWANNGGRAVVTRPFNTPMKPGDSFNVRFDNNWINNGSEVGMEFRSSNASVRLRFSFVGGQSTYRVFDAQGNRSTAVPFSDSGLNVTLGLLNSGGYSLNTGSQSFTGNLAAGEAIAWVEFFNNNAGPDTPFNLYIGAMSHIIAPLGNEVVTANTTITRLADTPNSIPTSWWELYGIAPGNRVASADQDGDGFNNAQEYDLGTDPTSAASRFSAEVASRSGNSVTINWSSVAGKRYQVQAKADLADAWSDVGSAFTANGTTGTQSVTIPSGSTKHFFRVRLLP